MSGWLWGAINLAQGLFLIVWTVGLITLALLLRVLTGGTGVPLTMARRLWAPGLLSAGAIRVEVEGRSRLDRETTYLFAVNHRSQIDIAVLFRALPRNVVFIVKEESRTLPFVGWYIAAMGMIFVDRRSRVKAMAAMSRAAEVLRGGQDVVTFPEGTRSRDGRIRPFKTGVLLPAIEAGAPVVPVAIIGAGRVLPPDGFSARPGVIRVRIGEPIATAGRGAEDRRRLAAQVREAVAVLRDPLYGGGVTGRSRPTGETGGRDPAV